MAYGKKSEPKPKMGPREQQLREMREARADTAKQAAMKAKGAKTVMKLVKKKGSGRGR
jgi:hypothetical protein